MSGYEIRLDEAAREIVTLLWGAEYVDTIEADLTAYAIEAMVELAGAKPEVKAVPSTCPIMDITSTSALCAQDVTDGEGQNPSIQDIPGQENPPAAENPRTPKTPETRSAQPRPTSASGWPIDDVTSWGD